MSLELHLAPRRLVAVVVALGFMSLARRSPGPQSEKTGG